MPCFCEHCMPYFCEHSMPYFCEHGMSYFCEHCMPYFCEHGMPYFCEHGMPYCPCGTRILIWYDIFVNYNWVATRWQYSAHLHTNNTRNNTKQAIHRTTRLPVTEVLYPPSGTQFCWGSYCSRLYLWASHCTLHLTGSGTAVGLYPNRDPFTWMVGWGKYVGDSLVVLIKVSDRNQ